MIISVKFTVQLWLCIKLNVKRPLQMTLIASLSLVRTTAVALISAVLAVAQLFILTTNVRSEFIKLSSHSSSSTKQGRVL